MPLLLFYLPIINACTFLLMLIDKQNAIKKRRRIPEKTLFTLCGAGGSLGGYLGMKLFRHKTRHPRFSVGIPIMMAIHAVIIILIIIF